jgi:hypothetical protein
MRSAGTYLYGRRMYETLAVWETDSTLAAQSDLMADYASAWQAADKVVYSSTLTAPPTANTRLERHFDPRPSRYEQMVSGCCRPNACHAMPLSRAFAHLTSQSVPPPTSSYRPEV